MRYGNLNNLPFYKDNVSVNKLYFTILSEYLPRIWQHLCASGNYEQGLLFQPKKFAISGAGAPFGKNTETLATNLLSLNQFTSLLR